MLEPKANYRQQVNNTCPTSTTFLADIANQKTSLNLTKKKIGTLTFGSHTSLVTKKDYLARKMHGSVGSTDLWPVPAMSKNRLYGSALRFDAAELQGWIQWPANLWSKLEQPQQTCLQICDPSQKTPTSQRVKQKVEKDEWKSLSEIILGAKMESRKVIYLLLQYPWVFHNEGGKNSVISPPPLYVLYAIIWDWTRKRISPPAHCT